MKSDRKRSEESFDSDEEGTELFPRHATANLKQALEVLTEHYDAAHHAIPLANCCFRCHIPQIVQAYNQFRLKVHPNLHEPKISNLYRNDQFVDMHSLTRDKKDKTINIPDPLIHPIPQNLTDILDHLFERYGYIPNLERFLLYYPSYLEKHRIVEADLFQSGKVESKSAYFVALCGAAEMGSVYMMARYLKHYLKTGGSMEWFNKEHFPPKFRLLRTLNRLMARAPWEITPQAIENILENQQIQCWNRSELARYIQIMAFSHQNSAIALSIGLLPQEQSLLGLFNMTKILKMKEDYDSLVYQSMTQKQKLAVMIPVLQQFDDDSSQNEPEIKKLSLGNKKNNDIKKSMKKNDNVDPYMKEINIQLTNQVMYSSINGWVQPLLPPFQLIDKRGEAKNNVLDYSEYNYKFMAYPILNSLTQDTADKIESMIAYSEIMTRGNFGSEKINHTKEFRKAVRYYAENLCGYTHHEYDFKSNVGSFLTMALKFYVRLVAMSPLHINSQVITATNHERGQKIECFDLGHLCVLIANTKMSLQLTMTIQAFEL